MVIMLNTHICFKQVLNESSTGFLENISLAVIHYKHIILTVRVTFYYKNCKFYFDKNENGENFIFNLTMEAIQYRIGYRITCVNKVRKRYFIHT